MDPCIDQLLAGDVDAGEQRPEREVARVAAAPQASRDQPNEKGDHDDGSEDSEETELREGLRQGVVGVWNVV